MVLDTEIVLIRDPKKLFIIEYSQPFVRYDIRVCHVNAAPSLISVGVLARRGLFLVAAKLTTLVEISGVLSSSFFLSFSRSSKEGPKQYKQTW